MTLAEFLIVTTPTSSYKLRPLIVCNDGTEISVQASDGHYSVPRKVDSHYSAVEVYTKAEDKDLDYFKSAGVYSFVDTNVVEKVINNHGGINVLKTFYKK